VRRRQENPVPTVDELQLQVLELQKRIAQIQLEDAQQARADRETKKAEESERIAKEKQEAAGEASTAADEKRAKERAARRAAAVADINSISTGLTSLTSSSVTYPEKSVFREALVAATALDAAGALAAEAIRRISPAPADPILVSGRTDQVETVLACQAFREAVTGFAAAAERALKETPEDVIASDRIRRAEEPKEEGAEAGTPEVPASILGALVGLGVAALNALTIETAIEGAARTASELETHIAVMDALLATSGAIVLHETVGLPDPNSPVLKEFQALQVLLPELDAKSLFWQRQIDKLDKDDEEQKRLIDLYRARKEFVDALAVRIADFVSAANTADATSGTSPLRSALRAARLVDSPSGAPKYLAVVLAARIDSHQISLKRRLFAPRLLVSASAEIDLVVLSTADGGIKAAKTLFAEKAFQVRFPMWWWGKDERFEPRYRVLNVDPITFSSASSTRVQAGATASNPAETGS
jgi:hypothetical protein